MILNTNKNTVIARNVTVADTFLSRMVGLLNRRSLPQDDALIITRCNSIHMFFMRFPIDAVFVDSENHVVGLVEHIKPNRLSRVFFGANACIELSAGTIGRTNTSVGDKIEIRAP